ncbi:MAG: serine/threonine protein kinase [Proteobacteria bacterium]|nr:serine/threonine protein kinase [Pseudomonadota bacterium]
MTDDVAALAFAGLQPEDIVATLSDLGFDCDGRFLALNSYENRVYQIGIENERPVVAKFYRPGRWSDESILEEHQFSIDLAAQEIPVIPPLEIEGSTLNHAGPFRLAVFPCHGGRSPDLDNYELLTQLGHLVARIHLEGEGSSFVHRPRIDIESYGVDSMDFLLENDFIPDENYDAYESVAELVLDGVEASFERAGDTREIRLHGDFHPGNVLVNQDRLHIVDLDDCRHGPGVQDLWMFLSGDRIEQTPQLEALLEGYQSFRSFDPRELHLIEALRSLRIMHYSAWLARRWEDPAFKVAFPWFDSPRYWDDHILALREQVALMQEPPLEWRDF